MLRVLVTLVLASIAPPAAAAPLTLSEAYRTALARAPRIKIAEDNVAAAQAQKSLAWTRLGPTLDLTGQGTAQNQIVENGNTFQFPYVGHAGAVLQVPVLRKGFLDGLTSAQAGIESAGASLERERQLLMLEVVRAFLGVMSARAQVGVAESAVKRAETELELTRARMRAGGALRTHELLSAIDLRRAKLQANDARAAAGTTSATLERLLAHAFDELVLPELPGAPTLPEALELGHQRFDVAAARLGVTQAANALSSTQGRRLWPRFDVQSNADYFNPPVPGVNFTWRVLGTLTVPLIETGAEYANISVARAALRISEDALEQVDEAVGEEIKANHARLQAAEQSLSLSKDQVADARENFSLVGQQFKLGAVTFLEVTNAQAVLTEAENTAVVSQFSQRLSTYELLGSAGTINLEADSAPSR